MSGIFVYVDFASGCSILSVDRRNPVTDTNTAKTIEVAVLSMHEKATHLVTAESMCAHAFQTKLHLFTSAEFEDCPKPKEPGVYIVPVQDEGSPVRLNLLEVTKTGSRVRETEISVTAGWSVKCRWLFKR